ncbi:MAG: RibD family protein [Granulosicoccus sp.]
MGNWCRKPELPSIFHSTFDLYLPALGNRSDTCLITAHLGQSIDARIATSDGDSFYVTGEVNRKHLHCLRAMCDAVIVGSRTIIADNPQLTTRAVSGTNPVRVIIDPSARLHQPLRVFDDGQARTILIHQSSADLSGRQTQFGPLVADNAGNTVRQVQRCIVPDSDDELAVKNLVALLNRLGLQRLFVEGGGNTVSRFFEERVLDRLQVAVAPLLVGAGTPALQLTGVTKMLNAYRPPHTVYRMGEDVLWDFDVSMMKNDSLKSVVSNDTSDSSQLNESGLRFSFERLF